MGYRPPAFVQVDVDGLWAIRACYARPEGESFVRDPVWLQGVPGFVDLFGSLGLPASFFLVGRDLEHDGKAAEARMVAREGHELANHSYTHRIGLSRLPVGEALNEIRRTHEAFAREGLPEPVGFRSPGYDIDARVLRAVRRMGYAYDASLLPTRLTPLLRLADAWLARKWQPGKRQFGRFAYGAAPRVPYCPSVQRVRKRRRSNEHTSLVELPVTTIAPLGFPLTGSAIFAFGSRRVMRAIEPSRRARRPLLIVLHGIDMVDCDRPIVFRSRTASAGGFNMTARAKRARIREVLSFIQEKYDVQLARDWVARYSSSTAEGRTA